MDDSFVDQVPRPVLQYDGDIGDLYAIFFLNMLFKILTLGIYRFWGITRYRRYLWSHMRFQDERFEYSGTGGELFKGFLLALLVLAGLGIGAAILSAGLGLIWQPLAGFAFLLIYPCVFVLAAGAVFAAQRYRLSRTLWCGIRGGMTGSMLGYGARSVLTAVLSFFTLFQLGPWRQIRLAERRVNASSFGNAAFRFQGSARQIYWPFLITFIANCILLAVIAFYAWRIIEPFVPAIVAAMHAPKGAPQPPLPSSARWFNWIFIGAILLFSTLSALIRCIYTAAFYRHVARNSSLGGVMTFASAVSGAALFRFTLVNILIAIGTMGFGYPILLHRDARFLARHLLANGGISHLAQSVLPEPRRGEGMFELLDGGGVF